MAKRTILEAPVRHKLLGMIVSAGDGPAGVAKVARRFKVSTWTLARWIVGTGGPFEADRAMVEKACAKVAAEGSAG